MQQSVTKPDSANDVLDPMQPPLPSPGKRLRWSRLYGDSLALALGSAALRHDGLLLVVTTDSQEAEQLQSRVRFFCAELAEDILCFPDWETLPYDRFSPHQDIISERLETLHRLPGLRKGILLLPVATLLQRLPPPEFIDRYSLLLRNGDRLDLDAMRSRLETAGYRCVSQVMEHGEFAVRGAILDLFPMGSTLPYRVDLFDDEIESIRSFDPDSQRSLDRVERVSLLPAREFPVDDAAVTRFRRAWRSRFEGDPQRALVYRDVSAGLVPAGIECYLPLFLEQTASLFDYLPRSSCLVTGEDTPAAMEHFRAEVAERYESLRHDVERPLLPPEQLYLTEEETAAALSVYARIDLQRAEALEKDTAAVRFATRALPDLRIRSRAERPAGALQDFLAGFNGRTLICTESAGRRETLLGQLKEFGIQPRVVEDWEAFINSEQRVAITVAPLEQGAWLETEPALTLLTEPRLFGERVLQQRRRRPKRDADVIISNLTDLHVGAPVVHEDHGVGRYLGLQKLSVGGLEGEFLTLEYAGNDKLYVPVSSMHLISRYTGSSPDSAPLHRLGSDHWQKARKKAARRVHDVAAELLDIYARRAARKGRPAQVDMAEYNAFASAFPFEETPDQAQAIEAVLADMLSEQPMDRVVCGDVGFGKTEVAMRAAFIATQSSRQVVVLVPTTLLAQQHYQNFCDRFADWPIRVEVLSRFRSKKQQDEIIASFTSGKVDILIGTHKVL
ncbi:MAG TPA: DEAD/DEAH box helicase, partial [Gammaproteobacteria bacterium]|nr:DEAD/DEAH box helicase [Gammaproteobacteria bacterium]